VLLRLILGEAGSGKTSRIHEEFLERAKRPLEERTILIVPEQITLLEQKRLIEELPARGLMGADVLSFQRLAHRVLSEKGERDLVVLDEVGKSMLLYRLAQELAPQMVYYGGSVHSQGFLQRLKSLFMELSQYEVTQESLERAAEAAGEDSSLRMKLQDIALLHARYEEEILQYGEMSEKLLDRLAEAIPESKLIKKAHIYVDDFYGFTPQQLRVLNGLMYYGRDLTVSLTIPIREAEKAQQEEEGDLFDTSRRMLSDLTERARSSRVPVQVIYTRYDKKDCIRYMAREFFRIPPRAWQKRNEGVELYAACGARAEVRQTFEKIVYLIREEGYSYREIGNCSGRYRPISGADTAIRG